MTRTRRSFGNLRKLPSGRYQARYTGPDLREHRPPTTFTTRRDAEAWLAGESVKIQRGEWTPPSAVHAEHVAAVAMLFKEYAEEVLERRLADGKIRETTAALYRRYLRLHFNEFAKQPLTTITPRQVSTWHASMAGTPATRANCYGLLSMIMHEAIRDELLDKSPCRVAAGGVKRSARTTEDEVMTVAEFSRYIAHVPERHGYRMALTIAFWCGLRSGEIRGLRRGDIDLKRGELTVAQQVVKLNGKNAVQQPVKTDAGHRVVAIPPHLVAELRHWLATVPMTGADALLFRSPTGLPMSGEALRAAGKSAAEAIGRPTLRVHSLRHSSATLVSQSGATTAEMMGRFGWSTPTMATRYSHAVRERDRELAARLSALA